jgi:hypothetical protein
MPLQNASATLAVTTRVLAVTGFIDFKQGFLDPETNTIKAQTIGTWSSLSGTTWANWSDYSINPSPILWTSELIDNGEVRYFTLSIDATFDGEIEYFVHVSETGQFGGEETETYIGPTTTDIPAFYGQFVYVTARVTGKFLNSLDIESNNSTLSVELRNLDTSTLSGTASERILTLDRPISFISDMKISVLKAPTFQLDMYVTDYPTSNVLIPIVLDKQAASAKFSLRGLDNIPRNGIVDISITALPRQVRIGGSVFVIN